MCSVHMETTALAMQRSSVSTRCCAVHTYIVLALEELWMRDVNRQQHSHDGSNRAATARVYIQFVTVIEPTTNQSVHEIEQRNVVCASGCVVVLCLWWWVLLCV